MAPGGSGALEGVLLFTGAYAPADFDQLVAMAESRHGSAAARTTGADGRRILPLGAASLVALDDRTWAVVQGPAMRAHLTGVALRGPRAFRRDLIPIGPRIGLPRGSTSAWADQQRPVGSAMFALVLQGANPRMMFNFVDTVRTHLRL